MGLAMTGKDGIRSKATCMQRSFRVQYPEALVMTPCLQCRWKSRLDSEALVGFEWYGGIEGMGPWVTRVGLEVPNPLELQ